MADPDLTERLAKEADLEFSATVGLDGEPNDVPTTVATLDDMRRFAALVAERCAEEAEPYWTGTEAAKAIRAMFKEPAVAGFKVEVDPATSAELDLDQVKRLHAALGEAIARKEPRCPWTDFERKFL